MSNSTPTFTVAYANYFASLMRAHAWLLTDRLLTGMLFVGDPVPLLPAGFVIREVYNYAEQTVKKLPDTF